VQGAPIWCKGIFCALINSDHVALLVRLTHECVVRLQVVTLNNAGERTGLATAIFEHAGSTVALAGALYCGHRYEEAADAYKQALEVRNNPMCVVHAAVHV
jgi:hypothetical protein